MRAKTRQAVSRGVLSEGDTGFHPDGRVVVVTAVVVLTLPIVEGMYPDDCSDERIIESEISEIRSALREIAGDAVINAEVHYERAEVSG